MFSLLVCLLLSVIGTEGQLHSSDHNVQSHQKHLKNNDVQDTTITSNSALSNLSTTTWDKIGKVLHMSKDSPNISQTYTKIRMPNNETSQIPRWSFLRKALEEREFDPKFALYLMANRNKTNTRVNNNPSNSMENNFQFKNLTYALVNSIRGRKIPNLNLITPPLTDKRKITETHVILTSQRNSILPEPSSVYSKLTTITVNNINPSYLRSNVFSESNSSLPYDIITTVKTTSTITKVITGTTIVFPNISETTMSKNTIEAAKIKEEKEKIKTIEENLNIRTKYNTQTIVKILNPDVRLNHNSTSNYLKSSPSATYTTPSFSSPEYIITTVRPTPSLSEIKTNSPSYLISTAFITKMKTITITKEIQPTPLYSSEKQIQSNTPEQVENNKSIIPTPQTKIISASKSVILNAKKYKLKSTHGEPITDRPKSEIKTNTKLVTTLVPPNNINTINIQSVVKTIPTKIKLAPMFTHLTTLNLPQKEHVFGGISLFKEVKQTDTIRPQHKSVNTPASKVTEENILESSMQLTSSPTIVAITPTLVSSQKLIQTNNDINILPQITKQVNTVGVTENLKTSMGLKQQSKIKPTDYVGNLFNNKSTTEVDNILFKSQEISTNAGKLLNNNILSSTKLKTDVKTPLLTKTIYVTSTLHTNLVVQTNIYLNNPQPKTLVNTKKMANEQINDPIKTLDMKLLNNHNISTIGSKQLTKAIPTSPKENQDVTTTSPKFNTNSLPKFVEKSHTTPKELILPPLPILSTKPELLTVEEVKASYDQMISNINNQSIPLPLVLEQLNQFLLKVEKYREINGNALTHDNKKTQNKITQFQNINLDTNVNDHKKPENPTEALTIDNSISQNTKPKIIKQDERKNSHTPSILDNSTTSHSKKRRVDDNKIRRQSNLRQNISSTLGNNNIHRNVQKETNLENEPTRTFYSNDIETSMLESMKKIIDRNHKLSTVVTIPPIPKRRRIHNVAPSLQRRQSLSKNIQFRQPRNHDNPRPVIPEKFRSFIYPSDTPEIIEAKIRHFQAFLR